MANPPFSNYIFKKSLNVKKTLTRHGIGTWLLLRVQAFGHCHEGKRAVLSFPSQGGDPWGNKLRLPYDAVNSAGLTSIGREPA